MTVPALTIAPWAIESQFSCVAIADEFVQPFDPWRKKKKINKSFTFHSLTVTHYTPSVSMLWVTPSY